MRAKITLHCRQFVHFGPDNTNQILTKLYSNSLNDHKTLLFPVGDKFIVFRIRLQSMQHCYRYCSNVCDNFEKCVFYLQSAPLSRLGQTFPLIIISNWKRRLDNFPAKIIIGSNKIKLNAQSIALVLKIILDCFCSGSSSSFAKANSIFFFISECVFFFPLSTAQFSIFNAIRLPTGNQRNRHIQISGLEIKELRME